MRKGRCVAFAILLLRVRALLGVLCAQKTSTQQTDQTCECTAVEPRERISTACSADSAPEIVPMFLVEHSKRALSGHAALLSGVTGRRLNVVERDARQAFKCCVSLFNVSGGRLRLVSEFRCFRVQCISSLGSRRAHGSECLAEITTVFSNSGH
jgi:hypothetical protein